MEGLIVINNVRKFTSEGNYEECYFAQFEEEPEEPRRKTEEICQPEEPFL